MQVKWGFNVCAIFNINFIFAGKKTKKNFIEKFKHFKECMIESTGVTDEEYQAGVSQFCKRHHNNVSNAKSAAAKAAQSQSLNDHQEDT